MTSPRQLIVIIAGVGWTLATTPAWAHVSHEQQELLPVGVDFEDQGNFGFDVAIDGDRALVTAPLHGPGAGPEEPSTHVFERIAGTWVHVGVLPGLVGGDPPHGGIAIDGDTAMSGGVFGAWDANDEVVCYEHDGSAWLPLQTLSTTGLGLFGSSIAIDGSLSVIGRPGYFEHSAAVVFRRSAGSWLEDQELSGPPYLEASFGEDVAIDGDTVVVGSPGTWLEGVQDVGTVHVYVLDPATQMWIPRATLTPPVLSEPARFGAAVAIAGNRLLVAQPGSSSHPGRAHLYEGSGTTWTLVATLQSATAHRLARDVVLSEHTALLGSETEVAYVFVRLADGSWIEQQRLELSHPELNDHFGWSVAMSGPDALVGAPQFNANEYGSAYHFRLPAPNGVICGVAAHCESGYCVDGLCCDGACGGGDGDCQACSVKAGAEIDGTCGPITTAFVCREPHGPCDTAEACDGLSLACPPDGTMSDGAVCDDARDCTVDDVCFGGVCGGTDRCGAGGVEAPSGTGGSGAVPSDSSERIVIISGCGCLLVPRQSLAWPWLALLVITLYRRTRRES